MTLFKALNVSKSFKKGFLKSAYLNVLNSISINIESGEAVAIVGPNGSGKSTFINLITGLYRPSSGQVLYRDKVIDGTSHMKDITACMANGTGLVMDMKVRQFLTYKSRLYEREFDEKSEYIDMMQLRRLLDKRISFCSAGETQRINILGSLIAYPEVFIFDEPTNCLDIQTKFIFLDILEAIKREGKTIILVTHHTDEIMRMKRMVMFGNGRIVSDHAVEGSRELIDKRLLDLCNNHYSKGVI